MNKFLDFIEKRRWGILATFMIHLAALLYLQIDTYSYALPDRKFEVMSEVIEEDFIELNPEQIVIPEDFKAQQTISGEVKNLTQNASDKRQKSLDNFSRSSTDQKVEQNVKDLERQFFEEMASSRANGEGSKHSDEGGKSGSSSGATSVSKSNDNAKPLKENTSNSAVESNSDKQYGGNTMVRFELVNRFPHNKNDWYIRNPGYTCGGNANGLVVVSIRVNQNGDVISAKYVSEMSSNANSCMIEQAEIYAKKSRFAYKGDAPKAQDGFIYYTFVSKK
jgi:hypothetical protein